MLTLRFFNWITYNAIKAEQILQIIEDKENE